MSELDKRPAAGHADGGFDVVTWSFDPAALSLICAIFPFLVGFLIDDLPFVAPALIRRHLSEIVLGALGTTLLGTIFGARALRRPGSRGLARLGFVANLVIFLLLGLFVIAFRFILNR